MDDSRGLSPEEEEEMMLAKFPPEDVLVCSIIMIIIGLIGLVSNSLMLRAWIKYPNLRNDFYTVFAALSLADMAFLIISVPANVVEMRISNMATTEAWCKYSIYFVNVFGFIAAFLLVVLATLRAILLTNRNTIPRPRAKHLIIISIFTYVVVFLVSIPITSMYDAHEAACLFQTDFDFATQTWLLNSFSAFVPLFLVFLLYFITYILGKRYFADSYSPHEKQKSRLVNSVVLAFIVCQIPYRILSIYIVIVDPNDPDTFESLMTAKDYLMCLLMAGKVVRPVLCSKLTTDLGHAFDEIINCQGCNKTFHRANTAVIETATPEVDDGEPPSPLPRARDMVDRSISTSSSTSTNSQTPLIRNPSPPSEIEMT